MLRRFDLLGRRAGGGQVAGTIVREHTRPETCWRRCEIARASASETRRMSCSRVSVVPSQRSFPQAFGPKIVGRGRVPGRHVDSVGHVSDRDFVLRPARKQRLKEAPADLPVQAAHAIYRPAPADRQIRHVERLRRVVRVLAAQGQQIAGAECRASARHTRRGIAR